MKEELFENIAT